MIKLNKSSTKIFLTSTLIVSGTLLASSIYFFASGIVSLNSVKREFEPSYTKFFESSAKLKENLAIATNIETSEVMVVLDKEEIYDKITSIEDVTFIRTVASYRVASELKTVIIENRNEFLNLKNTIESISFVVSSSDLLVTTDIITSYNFNIASLVINTYSNEITFTVNMFSEGVINVVY